MQNIHIPETAESRIVPKWLFPPRFPNKDRITSSCPDLVLVTPVAAKTQKQQINVGGWVLRSGSEQLRETGSTPAAPPATSSATIPRQHWPKTSAKLGVTSTLSKSSIVRTSDLRTSWTTQRNSTKISATFSEEPPLLSTSSFWVWVAPSTTLSHSEAYQGTGSRFSKS